MNREVTDGVRTALSFVMKYVAFLSAWVIIGYLITGGESLARRGLSLPGVIGWYFGSALVIGVLAGFLQPWADTRAKGALVGFAISIPITLTYYFAMSRTQLSGGQLIVAVALIGTVLGAPIGAMYWRR